MTMDQLVNRVCAWWEARQRQKRFQSMLRASPALKAAAEAHDRHQRQHKPSRADQIAMRQAVADMLGRREVRG